MKNGAFEIKLILKRFQLLVMIWSRVCLPDQSRGDQGIEVDRPSMWILKLLRIITGVCYEGIKVSGAWGRVD